MRGRIATIRSRGRGPSPFEELNPQTAGAWYYSEAKAGGLISQKDERLRAFGVDLDDEPGYCATACVINALSTLSMKYSHKFAAPEKEMADFLKYLEAKTGQDPSEGFLLDDLASQTQAKYGKNLWYESFVDGQLNPELMRALFKDNSGLFIGSVSPAANLYQVAHAIVILEIDMEKRTLVISDPNRPANIFRTDFFIGADNRMHFDLGRVVRPRNARSRTHFRNFYDVETPLLARKVGIVRRFSP